MRKKFLVTCGLALLVALSTWFVTRVPFSESLRVAIAQSEITELADGSIRIEFTGQVENVGYRPILISVDGKCTPTKPHSNLYSLVICDPATRRAPLLTKAKWDATRDLTSIGPRYVETSRGNEDLSEFQGITYVPLEPGCTWAFRESFAITKSQWDSLAPSLAAHVYAEPSARTHAGSWFASSLLEFDEPSDPPKDRASRFENGESTAGPR